jgi:hypothetical protein
MPRTFADRLAVLTDAVTNGTDAAEAVRSSLGVRADRTFATDTHMIRDLFKAVNGGRARFNKLPCGYWVVGANDLGRSVIAEISEIEDAGGAFASDLNGNFRPALWLRALIEVLGYRLMEEEALAEQRAGFGCSATWGE